MGDDFMELWTCQKLVTVDHTIDSVPAVIKLDSVAECGGVLTKIGEDDITCIELDEHFEQSTGVGQETLYVHIDNVHSGDVVEISYFPCADKKIGEIDDYSATSNGVDIEFTDLCTACKLKHAAIYGMIIRDLHKEQALFVVPAEVSCKMLPYVTFGEIIFKPDKPVEDAITWGADIDCEYYWRTIFTKEEIYGPAIPETEIIGPAIPQPVIANIETRSTGLEQSQNQIEQSIKDIDETLAPYFKKAGVVMGDEAFTYQSNIGMNYHLMIDDVDGKWGLYTGNTMQRIRLYDADIDEITAYLPHILPFLVKYAEQLKILESEYTPVADTAKRIADSIKS